MPQYSKPIQDLSDVTRHLVSDLLGGEDTRGFDIDSLYYTSEGWTVIEFCRAITFPANKSHPSRFSWNWKKFASLWAVATELKGKLYVVNYDDKRDRARVLVVKNVVPQANKYHRGDYITAVDILFNGRPVTTFAELKSWYSALNRFATFPWEPPPN